MCIAFPNVRHASKKRGLLARGWWMMASSPLRLFSLGALFHAVVIILMYQNSLLAADANSFLFILFGIPGWFVLGFILSIYPHWFHCGQVEYSTYGLAHMLTFTGMLVAELGGFNNLIFNTGGLILLALGWLVSLHAIRWMYQWGQGVRQTIAPYLSLALQVALWLIVAAVPVSLLNFMLLEQLLVSAAAVVMLLISAGLVKLYFQLPRDSSI